MKHTAAKLQSYLDSCQDKAFSWGEFDCCLFVCDWLQLLNGSDLAHDFRGHYSTQFSAFKHIKTLGFKDVEDVFKHLIEYGMIKLDDDQNVHIEFLEEQCNDTEERNILLTALKELKL